MVTAGLAFVPYTVFMAISVWGYGRYYARFGPFATWAGRSLAQAMIGVAALIGFTVAFPWLNRLTHKQRLRRYLITVAVPVLVVYYLQLLVGHLGGSSFWIASWRVLPVIAWRLIPHGLLMYIIGGMCVIAPCWAHKSPTSAWPRFFVGLLATAGLAFVPASTYGAFDIFVRGNYDYKFGPVDTWRLGNLFIAVLTAATVFGFVVCFRLGHRLTRGQPLWHYLVTIAVPVGMVCIFFHFNLLNIQGLMWEVIARLNQLPGVVSGAAFWAVVALLLYIAGLLGAKAVLMLITCPRKASA